jgi:hypothetical protein
VKMSLILNVAGMAGCPLACLDSELHLLTPSLVGVMSGGHSLCATGLTLQRFESITDVVMGKR